ncbi:MAG: FxLYD domain-containing protein [Methyloceanibacter sp.]
MPQPDPPPPHAAARVAEAARPEFAGTPPGPVVDAEYDFEGDFPGQAGRVNADPPSVPPPPAEKRGLFAKLTGKRGKPAEAPRPVPAEMMPPPGGQADAVFTDASFTTGVDASYTPTGNAPYTPTAGASYTPTGDASFTPPEDKVDDATLADPAMVAAAFGETLPRKRERKGTSIVTIGWSVLGLIVAIVFGMLIFAPSTVVSMLPGTARLYSMFGAPIGMTGLAFEGVHYGWTNDGSQTVLEVQGNVRNVSSLTMTVPTVVIALRDEKGEEISEWTTEVGETELGAGEQAAFLRQIPSPPSNVRSLKVRFAKAD